MNDERLRDALSRAHAHDAPPFARVWTRAAARPRRPSLVPVALAAAALVAIVGIALPDRDDTLARLAAIEQWKAPTDSLFPREPSWTAPTDPLLEVPP